MLSHLVRAAPARENAYHEFSLELLMLTPSTVFLIRCSLNRDTRLATKKKVALDCMDFRNKRFSAQDNFLLRVNPTQSKLLPPPKKKNYKTNSSKK
jgi:hypothetical protein